MINRREMLGRSLAWLAAAPLLRGVALGEETTGSQTLAGAGQSAVATAHPEAALAASKMLERGGNAVDAAVAAIMTLCVVQPGAVGIGGYGGSLIVRLAGKKEVKAIDFDSRAPLEFRPELYSDPEKANHGYLAAGVPGVAAGLDLALREFGTLGWQAAAEHAVHLAEEGVVLGASQARSLKTLSTKVDPATFRALFADKRVPGEGERWVQKDLARLLRELGKTGADAFYRGDIACQIVRQVRANGGILSEEDFRNYHAKVVDPIRISYRGYEIFSPPLPSGGLTSLSILKTLENFDLGSMEAWGARYWHLFAQTAKLCWDERFRLFGDPEAVEVPLEELLSAKRAAERAERVRSGKVGEVRGSAPEPMHTANVVVVDKQGNSVSMTATHGGGYGAQVAIEGLGLVLGHGMSRFTYEQGSPNYPRPGRRMQHNMSPMLILREGKPWGALGMPGGRAIVTVSAQLVASVVDFKASPEQAVRAARLHTEGREPLSVSSAMSQKVISGLEQMGHKVKQTSGVGGEANVVLVDGETGRKRAGSGAGSDSVRVSGL